MATRTEPYKIAVICERQEYYNEFIQKVASDDQDKFMRVGDSSVFRGHRVSNYFVYGPRKDWSPDTWIRVMDMVGAHLYGR